MRNIITLSILAFLSMCMAKAPEQQFVSKPHSIWFLASLGNTMSQRRAIEDKENLINAIIQVESGGNDAAVGDGGKAIGCLQIHAVMVKEVNRILGGDVYTLSDRKDRDKSIAMFKVYTEKYTPSWSPELVARRWNGGPRGEKKKATASYWAKVKKELP